MHEDDPFTPRSTSLYGAATWFEERLGIAYAIRYGLSFVALRYCGVFGNGGSDSRGMASIRARIAQSGHGAPVMIADASGDERAQMTYVGDAVDVTLRALVASTPRHFVYNVAVLAENYLSLSEYGATIHALFPGSGAVTFSERARSLGPVDTERIRRDLDWIPCVNVSDGLRMMFAEVPERLLHVTP